VERGAPSSGESWREWGGRTCIRAAPCDARHAAKLAARRRVDGERQLDALRGEVGVQADPADAGLHDGLEVLLVHLEDLGHARQRDVDGRPRLDDLARRRLPPARYDAVPLLVHRRAAARRRELALERGAAASRDEDDAEPRRDPDDGDDVARLEGVENGGRW